MSDEIDADQLIERTDTGVSITTTLKRGSGTRDEDKHVIKAKGHTFTEAASKYGSALNYLEEVVLDQTRALQPEADDGDD